MPPAAPFEPYVPANSNLRELTPLPLVLGSVLGVIFGASSLYLVVGTMPTKPSSLGRLR